MAPDEQDHPEAHHLPHHRGDDGPVGEVGVDAQPQDAIGDDAEVSEGRVDEPRSPAPNSQYQSRLEAPSPMTTGKKTAVRVNRCGPNFRKRATPQRSRRSSGSGLSAARLQREGQRDQELPVAEGLRGADPTGDGGEISVQLLNDTQTIWVRG